jgi:membrane peptidoglycan carboxypeptidase
MHYAPTAVLDVKNSSGAQLAAYTQQGTPGLDVPTSNLVTYALEGVVEHGTGTAAQLANRPVAGKTGTAQNFTNAWFCGYTPQLVTCVWMGYPKGNIPMHNVEGVPDVFGGSIPAAIWHDFMQQATRGMPVESLPKPDLSQFSRSNGSPTKRKTMDGSPAPAAAGTADQPLPSYSPIPADPNSPAFSPIDSPRPSPRPSPKPRPSPSPSPVASA